MIRGEKEKEKKFTWSQNTGERRRKMETLKRLIRSEKGVSPVIGTILMVAVTVIMAAIVGGFVYQTAKPKIPPTISTGLADDPLVGVDTDTQGNTAADPAATAGWNPAVIGYGNRVAKLTFEGGPNIAVTELSAIVVYTPDNATVETTVILDGVFWDDALTAGSFPSAAHKGNVMGSGTTPSHLWLMWVDVDGSSDITPGDRLDFHETDAAVAGEAVKRGTDFTVKILHKATQAFVTDLTIRVY